MGNGRVPVVPIRIVSENKGVWTGIQIDDYLSLAAIEEMFMRNIDFNFGSVIFLHVLFEDAHNFE